MTDEERKIFGRRRIFAPPGPPSFGNSPFWKFGELEYFCGNFNGWVQARKLIHGEQDILAVAR
jgi:hypothetical protein